MKINKNDIKNNNQSLYNITVKGSLGLLAYGDIGLREWRKIKQESIKKKPK